MRITNVAIRRAILAILVATDGFLDACKVHLFKNNINLSPSNVVGDFEEANFTGYAVSSVIVWGAPYTAANQFAEVQGGTKQFNATGDTVGNTVYGYYVTDTAGTGLKYAERFDEGIPMTEAGRSIVVNPKFTYDGEC